jgi:hypothetical protein
MEEIPEYWSKWLSSFYEKIKDRSMYTDKNIDKICVIVEPRKHPLLKYVIYNFMYLLAPYGWGLHVFCGLENVEFCLDILKTLEAHNKLKHVEITSVNKNNLDMDEYNILLTNEGFYKAISSLAKYVLIFQTDTILLDGDLSFFIEKGYDFVGAPWKHSPEKGCNGGLSLRNREKIIEICKSKPFYIYNTGKKNIPCDNEDGFFSFTHADSLNIPSLEEKKQFAMETIWSDNPKGLHKTYSYFDNEQIKSFLAKKWEDIFREKYKL